MMPHRDKGMMLEMKENYNRALMHGYLYHELANLCIKSSRS